VRGRAAILESTDVQERVFEVDLLPAKVDQFLPDASSTRFGTVAGQFSYRPLAEALLPTKPSLGKPLGNSLSKSPPYWEECPIDNVGESIASPVKLIGTMLSLDRATVLTVPISRNLP
jgi:hypothetical protein